MAARRLILRRLAPASAVAASLLLAACIQSFVVPRARAVAPPTDERQDSIRTPVKAHLADGSTVLFPKGSSVRATGIVGEGMRYALLSDSGWPVSAVPMDSVIGIEAYSERVLAAPTLIASAAATAATATIAAGLAVAIFGSCPTVYADTGTGLQLQAEGFSYAISPLMEHRDLDALRLSPGPDGVLRLELRNEAMETHFLNHVELVAVRHAPGTAAVADQGGRPVLVSGYAPAIRATDRAGRDVTRPLLRRDGAYFESSPATIGAAREGDLDDWIDLEADDVPAGDSIAVVLRLRNSLLNTVFLYEGMLGGRDAPDLLAQDLEHIAQTVDLGRWYVRTMGMRATVAGVPEPVGEPYEGHARLGDVGPIAFRDVALVLPRPAGPGPVRVRLRFVADNWRIDEARIAGMVSRPETTLLPVNRVVVPTPARGTGPVEDVPAIAALAAADDQYLETRPGQRMTLEFATPAGAADPGTTYLIAWQGWYREWIRPGWLARPTRTTPFVPGDAALLTALRSWTAQKEAFEHAFYSSMIPVR